MVCERETQSFAVRPGRLSLFPLGHGLAGLAKSTINGLILWSS
jgi:hypothetical protein